MTAITNPYFNHSSSLEQTLFQGLTTECIQVQGFACYYLPRHTQKIDPILGEDNLSKFDLAIGIELYYEDAEGWQGDQSIISKFGLEISNEMSFLISRDRWNTEIKSQFDGSPDNGEATFSILAQRPQEGDLIWEPLSKSLLEIKYVEKDKQFFPIGTNYYYRLKCEFFQYSSEEFSTGVTDIDSLVAGQSINLLDHQILMEDGFLLLQEDGYSLFQDTEAIIDRASFGKDRSFKSEADTVKWTYDDPFNERDFL